MLRRHWNRISLFLMVFYICERSFVACHDEPEAVEKKVKEVIEDVVYNSPKASGFVYLAESFDDIGAYKSRWILSEAQKDDTDETIAKYNGEWAVEAAAENPLTGDLGLVLKSQAKHHAISAKLSKPFVFDKKPFILQYEVNFQNGQDCGGAYLKLLSDGKGLNLKTFHDKTPYTVMFGPDKCGNDNKLHFIFRHVNPRNGSITEKHAKPPTGKLDEMFRDKKPHLYTLIIKPDNTYEVLVDNTVVNEGNLLNDVSPPVNPPAEIDDPSDIKPADWDEREKIPDPDAKKPEDWDESAPRQIPDPKAVKPDDWLSEEPETIPDENAVRPSDWDDEMDGEWEAPLISNPKCENVGCGEWKPAMIDNPSYKGKWYPTNIDNPNYRGKWKPRKIPNPDFFEDKNPFRMTSIAAVGLELWSMSNGIYFDNIVVTDDRNVAINWAKDSFELKLKKNDQSAEGLISRIVKYTNSNPWLWAVYVVVVALPIVLIVVFCCFSDDKGSKKDVGKMKKSDLSTPDVAPPVKEKKALNPKLFKDEPAEVVKEEEVVEEEDEEEEEEEEESSSAAGGDAAGNEKEVEQDDQAEEDEETVEEIPTEEPRPGRSPRRRRTRKD